MCRSSDGRQAGGAREAVKGSSRLTAGWLTAAPCLEYCSSESDLGHTPPPPSPPPPRQLRNLITRLLPEQAFASLRRLPTISATRVSACPHTPIPIGSRGSLRGQPPLPQAAQFLVTIRPGPVKKLTGARPGYSHLRHPNTAPSHLNNGRDVIQRPHERFGLVTP